MDSHFNDDFYDTAPAHYLRYNAPCRATPWKSGAVMFNGAFRQQRYVILVRGKYWHSHDLPLCTLGQLKIESETTSSEVCLDTSIASAWPVGGTAALFCPLSLSLFLCLSRNCFTKIFQASLLSIKIQRAWITVSMIKFVKDGWQIALVSNRVGQVKLFRDPHLGTGIFYLWNFWYSVCQSTFRLFRFSIFIVEFATFSLCLVFSSVYFKAM